LLSTLRVFFSVIADLWRDLKSRGVVGPVCCGKRGCLGFVVSCAVSFGFDGESFGPDWVLEVFGDR
jgi:hypothetical protein